MIDKNTFYGAARNQTLVATPEISDTFHGAKYETSGPVALEVGIARVWVIDFVGALDVNLPAANSRAKAGSQLGGPKFTIINIGAGTVTLKDAGGATLETLVANKACVIGLALNTTSDGTWTRHIQDVV